MATSTWRSSWAFVPYRAWSSQSKDLQDPTRHQGLDGGRFVTCKLLTSRCYGCPCPNQWGDYYLNASQPFIIQAWFAWWRPLKSASLEVYRTGSPPYGLFAVDKRRTEDGDMPYVVKAGSLW